MADNRVAGIFYVKVNGALVSASGAWTYNLGKPKGETILDTTGKSVGLKETPQIGFIEGNIINTRELDLDAIISLRDATCTLELANGKVILVSNGNQVGEGTANAEDATVPIRIEGRCEEVG
jgi:hypothetical protein